MVSTRHSNEVEIAVVGGGPAGAATAIRLAAAGREVALFERWHQPRWRASGVYSSPSTRTELSELLGDGAAGRLVRPISELLVESLSGASVVLVHGTDGPAVGVDRVRLEAALLARARQAGAQVHEGAVVREVVLGSEAGAADAQLLVSTPSGQERWRSRLVVGADGPRSLVARSAGVTRRPLPVVRAGLSVHRLDPAALPDHLPMTARLVFGAGWYVGVTPVPRGRVNVGAVLSRAELQRRLAGKGAPTAVMKRLLEEIPRRRGELWRDEPIVDQVTITMPLAHRVARVAGPGFVLVGDACGYVDPVSGEGIGRALQGAELAATAIDRWRNGDRSALSRYDQRLRARYRRKDLISWILQGFMGQPAMLDYAIRRLDRRPSVRRVFGMVMSDLAPPERALDPRFLAALLAP